MTSRVKHVVESLLAPLGERRIRGAWGRSRRIVLAYHNVVPDDWVVQGDRSLHIPVERFVAHLDRLSDLTEIRPLEDLVAGRGTPQDRPWAAITFDDAYLGALTFGIDEIVRRGLSATVFVTPGRLGGSEFWWDTLAAVLGPRFDQVTRDRALTRFAGEQDAILRAFAPSQYRSSLPEFARAATEEQLRLAAARPGVTLAAHGWSHRNLARLGPEELRAEVAQPARWLSDRFAAAAPYLAYPYGLYSPIVEDITRAAGYLAGFRVSGGGWRASEAQPFSLPRLNVPRGLSGRGLTLRMGGLL